MGFCVCMIVTQSLSFFHVSGQLSVLPGDFQFLSALMAFVIIALYLETIVVHVVFRYKLCQLLNWFWQRLLVNDWLG